jgi:hypothetical protein
VAITHARLIREVSWPSFIGLLVVTFVVFSLISEKRATQHAVTGTVTELRASEWISVAHATTDPMGFQIALRETTAYGGSRGAIKPCSRDHMV